MTVHGAMSIESRYTHEAKVRINIIFALVLIARDLLMPHNLHPAYLLWLMFCMFLEWIDLKSALETKTTYNWPYVKKQVLLKI